MLVRIQNCRRDQPAAAQRDRPADMNAVTRLIRAIDTSAVELRQV